MILTALERIAAYRMHTPKWAVAPTSGAGAAAHGGRANRPGTAALYLSLATETAVREYQQVSTLLPPGTLIAYRVSAAPVVDFRGGYQPAQWSALWEEFFCDWRELWFNRHVEPPSWVLADEAIAAGRQGNTLPVALVPRRGQSRPLHRTVGGSRCGRGTRSGWGLAQESRLLGVTCRPQEASPASNPPAATVRGAAHRPRRRNLRQAPVGPGEDGPTAGRRLEPGPADGGATLRSARSPR